MKLETLASYQQEDFSLLFEFENNINYEKIVEILDNHQGEEIVEYANVLGEFYNLQYFQKLEELLYFAERIMESRHFPKNISRSEQESLVEEVLIYVFSEEITNYMNYAESTSNCQAYYNNCKEQAVRDHGIRIAACTGIVVGMGVFTLGVGALSWPICMAASGYTYSSAMTGCRNAYEICKQQQ